MRAQISAGGIAAVVLGCVVAAQAPAGQDGRTAATAQLIDDLVTGNRILASEGILDGLGHISVRSDQRPDRFFLTVDVAPALATVAHVVEYDFNGYAVSPLRGRQMYQERYIHSGIFKARPDVMAVIHGHTPSVLPFADSSVALRPIYHMASFLAGGVPLFEIRRVTGSTGMLVNTVALGDALAQSLGDTPVALMRGHGFVAVGSNIPAVVSRSIFLDVNARAQAQAIALGGNVTYLDGADLLPIAPTPDRLPSTDPYGRSWPAWKAKAMGN